jgi:pentafunctional AROM polypeptide
MSGGVVPQTHSLSATVDAAAGESIKSTFKFDNYNKPIVLLGLSSGGNELQRLALSLSASLVGNNPKKLQNTLDKLERSQGALLVCEGDDDESDIAETETSAGQQVAGISLSAVGLDEEGPFVLDAGLIGELIREKTLSLTSGVLVLDFNHPAFQSSDNYNAKEFEIDLIRAMSSVAKQLYEEMGLLSVYVNVQPDIAEISLSDEAKERKVMIENEVLIPFSDYEICVKNEGTVDDSSWNNIEWELQRIVGRALLSPPVVGGTGENSADIMMGRNTFFLSLSFPKVEDASPYIEQMCQDVDSMEYRVDLLQASKDYLAKMSGGDNSCSDKDPRFDILYQQQRLRAMCRPNAQRAPALPFAGSSIIDDALPLVYTVRTAHQAGTWPDDKDGIKQMFELLDLGLRSGVEVLDIESAWDAALTDKLLKKAKDRYTSLILGSHHVVGEEVSIDEAIQLYRQCRMNGRAHGAKVVLSINGNDNDEDQLAYKASLAAAKMDKPEIPHIGLVLGEDGSYSRILNPRFTPVTHETLPFKAAPGQLTAAEIMAGRLLTGQVPTERYAILGHNIAYSVSPQMQGGAFAAVKLPHTYTRADVATVEEFVEGPIWNDDNFGGCSVTIPHKQNIIPHVDVLTDAAKEIGSVNTVIAKKDKKGKRVLIGDNTDWKGLYNPLRRRIGEDVKRGSYALILGGGGTARAAAYAAAKLGLDRIYYNRTPEKAQDLANEFGGVVASSLDNDAATKDSLGSILGQNRGNIQVVISTLPAVAEFKLPEWMLSSDPLPVVFDVNYKPFNTALLLQATANGCDVVRGSEMLWEQGVGQFELWTGRTAPYGVMKKVVLDNCQPKAE